MVKNFYLFLCALFVCNSIAFGDAKADYDLYRNWTLYSVNSQEEGDRISLNLSDSECDFASINGLKLVYKGNMIDISFSTEGRDRTLYLEEICISKLFDLFSCTYKPEIDYYFFQSRYIQDVFFNLRPIRDHGRDASSITFLYNNCIYSPEDHNLLEYGEGVGNFSSSFLYELGEQVEFGEWSKFVEPISLKTESKTGTPNYASEPLPTEYDKELIINSEIGKVARWTINLQEMRFCLTSGKNSYYFEVEFGESPMLKRCVQLLEDKTICYWYKDNGRIAALTVTTQRQEEIYYYDSDECALTGKIVITKDGSGTYVEELFDIAKEYRKYDIAPFPVHLLSPESRIR